MTTWERIRNARLVRVLGVYVAASWVVLQAIGLFMETMGLPAWTMPVALVLLGVGFVVVLATAWVQSRPGMEAREAAEQVPDDWELGVREIGSSIRAGRMPHLNWARAVAGGVIAIALLVGIAAIYRIRPGATSAPLSDAVVATMPFTVRGSDEVAELGEGMVNLLGTKLDGAGDLRSVDARALLATLGPDAAEGLDPDRAADVARRFGAGIYVLGEVVEAGGRIRIDAALYRTDGPELVAEADAEGSPEEFFSMVDEVAATILGNLNGDPGARVDRIAAVTTSSLPALKEFLSGERAFRAGEYAVALDRFQSAIEEDSLFALAYYRLAAAAEYGNRGDLVFDAAETAQRLSGRLSDRDRALLEASVAFREGDADEAERLYRNLLGRWPDDVLAWFELAEILFHLNPIHGRSGVVAREAFHKVLDYEPDNGAAMIHLVRIEAVDGRLAAMDTLVERYLPVAGEGERGLEVRAIQAFAHDDEETIEQVLEELAQAPDVTLQTTVWSIVLFAGDLGASERIMRLTVDPARGPDVRGMGYLWLAMLHLAGGRVEEAREDFDRARDIAPPAIWTYYEAVAMSLPFVSWRDEDAERILAGVGGLPAEPTGAPTVGRNHQGMEAHVRRFVEGLMAARQGRAEDVRRAATELRRLGGPRESPALGGDLARTLDGYVASRAGEPAEALAQLEGMEMGGGYFLSFWSALGSHAFARWVRASALEQAGRGEEAERWYATLGWATSYEIVYRAPAELARGRIAEAAGRRAEAAAHYERFAELWREADPELQPQVAEARRAAARLRAQ